MTPEDNLGVTMRLSWVDPRYPTLVLESYADGWVTGYSLNLDTGGLTRVCLCAARYAEACCCGVP